VLQQNVPEQDMEQQLAKADCHGIPQPERKIWLSPPHGTVVHQFPPWKEQLAVRQFWLKLTWQSGTG